MSTMDWINTAGGSWGVAANWVNSTNPIDHHVPTTSDNAVIDVPGNPTIVYQGSQPTVLTLQNYDTIWVNGSNAGGNATLTASQAITNDGTILLESSNSNYAETIATGAGTFTNDADGTIQVTNATGGPRTISGTLVNEGQVKVDTASYLSITGAYNAAGGTITGPGYIFNASLYVTESPASPTTVLIEGGGVTLKTNNLPNTTLWVQGNDYINQNATSEHSRRARQRRHHPAGVADLQLFRRTLAGRHVHQRTRRNHSRRSRYRRLAEHRGYARKSGPDRR